GLGALERGLGHGELARADYDRVVALAPARGVLEPALRALVDLSRDAGDGDALETYFERLAALAPHDGMLWLARGDAELATGHPERAIDSFGSAEHWFGTDPERRLEAIVRHGDALVRMGDPRAAISE